MLVDVLWHLHFIQFSLVSFSLYVFSMYFVPLIFLPLTFPYLVPHLPSFSLSLHVSSTGLKSTNLYYIQDGKVNDYALGFQVPVAPNISALHFTWQNKDPRIEVTAFT